MDKSFNISINLLPKVEAEVINRQRQFKKVQLFGTLVVATLFGIVSLTFGLAIIQSSRLKQSEANLNQVKAQIEKFKSKEITLLVVKDRIKEIDRLNSQKSKSALMYALINKLLTSSIFLNIVNIEKNSAANLVLTSRSVEELDNFLVDLLDKDKNEELVREIVVDNFSRGKDGTYRVALKLRSE